VIDTTGLDKAEVFRALYNQARPLGMGFVHFTPQDMPIEEARAIVGGQDTGDYPCGQRRELYFDYVKGRVMKIDLSQDAGFEERLFDRDNGSGSAAQAIAEIAKVTA